MARNVYYPYDFEAHQNLSHKRFQIQVYYFMDYAVCYPNWKYTVLTLKNTISELKTRVKTETIRSYAKCKRSFYQSKRSTVFAEWPYTISQDRITHPLRSSFTHYPASKDDWTKEPVRGPIVFGPWVPEGPYTLKQKKVIRPIFQPGIWNV